MSERVHIIYSWDKFQSNEKVKKKSENTNLPAQNERSCKCYHSAGKGGLTICLTLGTCVSVFPIPHSPLHGVET